MASTVTSDLDDSINVSVFEQSSPESLRPRALSPQLHDHLSSTSDDPTLNDAEQDYFFDRKYMKQCTSSRSSISSFPASVIHTIPFTDTEDASLRTPSRSQIFSNGRNSPAYKPPSNSYLSAFRHPNSVRALQLESEYADSDTQSIGRSPRHRKSPKSSYFGPRSPGSVHSSPTKRSSRPATPQQTKSSSKLKKEFPLVLLHCTLLPPTTTTRGSLVSEEILEAILPEDYRKRWRTLQDKVVKNTEVKQRGVLIAHPREDYELLEERLLEALELERPRIRKGHYMGTSKSDSDSGFESSSQSGTDEGSDLEEQDGDNAKNKCADCGKAVSCKVEQHRRWEVKIFAANGLMRSGAWSAAWEQMEKVDVEVAVWMPEDVRIEVEERLKALQAKEEAERKVEEPLEPIKKKRTRSNTARLRHDERMREIYGEPEKARTQEENDGLADTTQPEVSDEPVETTEIYQNRDDEAQHIPIGPGTLPENFPHHQQHTLPPDQDFFTFMKQHFRAIVNDQRNLAIVLLSILVLIFSVQNVQLNNGTSSPTNAETTSSTLLSTASVAERIQVGVESPGLSCVSTANFPAPSQALPVASEQESNDDLPANWRSENHVSASAPALDELSTVGTVFIEEPEEMPNLGDEATIKSPADAVEFTDHIEAGITKPSAGVDATSSVNPDVGIDHPSTGLTCDTEAEAELDSDTTLIDPETSEADNQFDSAFENDSEASEIVSKARFALFQSPADNL